jgi:hypothetical protein
LVDCSKGKSPSVVIRHRHNKMKIFQPQKGHSAGINSNEDAHSSDANSAFYSR